VPFSLLCSQNEYCHIVAVLDKYPNQYVYINDVENRKGRFSKVLYSHILKGVNMSAAT